MVTPITGPVLMPMRVRICTPAGKGDAGQRLLDLERRFEGGGGMVFLRQRQVEAGEQPVADEVVHHAAMALDHRHDGGDSSCSGWWPRRPA